MPGLLLKNFPAELHAKLKEEAVRHHRSMTGEALAILEQGLNRRMPPPLPDIKPYVGKFPLTDDLIREARRTGRP
ncbi:MAG: Arc family DNA-binding protein [Planctomycetota bacterium]